MEGARLNMHSAPSQTLFERRVLCAGRTVDVCVPIPADYSFLIALRNRSDVRRWFGDDRPLDTEKAAAWLSARAHRMDDVLLVIRHRSSNSNLGSIGWSALDAAKGTAEFGRLAVDPSVLRKLIEAGEPPANVAGSAQEAAVAVRDFAFQVLGIRTLLTCYKTGNLNAARINRRCGLKIRSPKSEDDPRMTYLELSREEWLRLSSDLA